MLDNTVGTIGGCPLFSQNVVLVMEIILYLLIPLFPICIVALVRSRHANYSKQDLWVAVKGFSILYLGLFLLFFWMFVLNGESVNWFFSVLCLLIVLLVIAGAMHVLSLPKLFSAAFLIFPKLGGMLSNMLSMLGMQNVSPIANVIFWVILAVLLLSISACWAWRETR